MRELPWTSAFTCADAAAQGWSRSALRHAVATGQAVQLRRGVYLPAACVDPVDRALAIAGSFRGAVLSHRSALSVHGLPVIGPRPLCPEVTVAPRSNGDLPGLQVHRAGLRAEDVIRDRTVTAVARTLIDVARHHSHFVSVPAIDAALHRQLTTPALVEDVLEYCGGWIWANRARKAWALADGRAESPLESISRLRFRQLRLPMPEPQKLIFDERGVFVARVDFYWDEYGVFGEADGRGKYLDADGRWDDDVRWRQMDRAEALGNLGLHCARWTWEDAWWNPHVIGERVNRAFRSAQARQGAGSPRLWTLDAGAA